MRVDYESCPILPDDERCQFIVRLDADGGRYRYVFDCELEQGHAGECRASIVTYEDPSAPQTMQRAVITWREDERPPVEKG